MLKVCFCCVVLKKCVYLYHTKTKILEIMKAATTSQELIRVRISLFDYDGTKSNRTEVRYVETLEEAEKMGWDYEIA